jgi:single-strand DNA-binding protein
MEVTGKLKVKYDTQQVSDKYKKRDFVLTIEPTSPYPQHISIQLTQDKVQLLDKFKVGDDMRVHFNLRGRQWNSPAGEERYFNTIEAWKIESTAYKNNSQTSISDIPAPESKEGFGVEFEDDLPF